EPDELRAGAESILDEERLLDCLRRRPEKEDQRDRHLRRDERVRQPARFEAGPLFHVSDGARCRDSETKSPPPTQGSTALVCFIEAIDDLVAALHRVVQALLCGLFPCPYGLELFVDHVADLRHVARADAT